jgi:hypothetical protein
LAWATNTEHTVDRMPPNRLAMMCTQYGSKMTRLRHTSSARAELRWGPEVDRRNVSNSRSTRVTGSPLGPAALVDALDGVVAAVEEAAAVAVVMEELDEDGGFTEEVGAGDGPELLAPAPGVPAAAVPAELRPRPRPGTVASPSLVSARVASPDDNSWYLAWGRVHEGEG